MNILDFLSNKPHYLVGLAQSAGVATYIVFFILAAEQFGPAIGESSSILAPAVFLLAFVISASICGSLLLGYPALLAISGKISDAIKILLWGIAWLIIIALSVASFILII